MDLEDLLLQYGVCFRVTRFHIIVEISKMVLGLSYVTEITLKARMNDKEKQRQANRVLLIYCTKVVKRYVTRSPQTMRRGVVALFIIDVNSIEDDPRFRCRVMFQMCTGTLVSP